LFPIDSNGNLTTKTEGTDVWGYEWNALDQLMRVTKNGIEQARFAYDPMGRRVEKAAGAVVTSYAYDGGDIIRETRGSVTLRHIHGPAVDEPLAIDDGAAISYLHADALGSVVKVTNGSGAVMSTLEFDPWGSLAAGQNQSGYAFTGREWDPEAALYYYRARYYDPKMGRFISEDPIAAADRHSQDLNPYVYAINDPVNKQDPFGEAYIDCAKKLAELAASIAVLQQRLFENALSPDGGHDNAIEERIDRIRKLMVQVARHCGDAGRKAAAAAAAAMAAATECFVVVATDICTIAPETCCNGRYVGPGGSCGT
jgi:RHS repeat-associated protein